MALSKDKKIEVVADLSGLLEDSKMTVIAQYRGVDVKSMQSLRKLARDNGTTVRVVKNRLFKRALKSNDKLKNADASILTGQLLYAFNDQDEAYSAQTLAAFAKNQPSLQFVGAIAGDGTMIDVDGIKMLASLPGKDQLRALMVGTLAAPLSGFANVLSANIRGVVNVLNARLNSL